MEKVKLTKVQTKAIEDIKGTMHLNLEANLREQIEKGWYGYPFGSLNKLTTKEFLDALYIGYEVEQEVKVGDFVDIGLFGISKVAEVTGVKGKLIAINGSDEYQEFKINRVLTDGEKQEEKQRRWWAKHGRKPLELKINDVLLRNDGAYVSVFDEDEAGKQYELVSSGAHADHYVVDTEHLKAFYKVICFAEDRKDVK